MTNPKSKPTMWDEKIEYLRKSRESMWNLDYLAFLVRDVWRIDHPVRVVDFGCGTGFLGAVLLPLLPQGSTYTGLDNSAKLLEQARASFADTKWIVTFVEQDLTEFVPTEGYDIAICQTVLVHIPSPMAILEKMAQSVVQGGRVICIEPNWVFTNLGTYRHGMEKYSYEDWGLHQKLIDAELERGGPDRYVGIKLPAMMHDLGLQDIDIRINDKANFDFRVPNIAVLARDRADRRDNRFNNEELYVKAGLDHEEAQRHVENILLTEDYENGHDGPLPTVSVMAWLISYGVKQ